MSSVLSQGTNGSQKSRHKDDLWRAAYQKMQRDPDGKRLLNKFQKSLQEELRDLSNPIGHLASSEGRKKLLELINAKAQTIKPEHGISDDIVQALLKTKNIVSTAAAASPPATIAVAGLFIAFSIQQNYVNESKAMFDCTIRIGEIIRRRVVEDGQIHSGSPLEAQELKELRQQLQFSYLDIYFKLLSAIVKLVYLLKSHLRRWFDNLIGQTDWRAEKKGLEDAERECIDNLESIHRYKSDPSTQPSPYSRKGRNLLHQNAANGIEGRVAEFIESNTFDPNARDSHQSTALSLAAEGGHLKCCIILLEVNSIEKDATNRDGRTALHLAAQKDRVDVVKTLINKRVNLNMTDKNGRTALHLAAEAGRLQVVKALCIACRIELNVQDSNGHTALHLATLRKKVSVVKFLVGKKAEVDEQNKKQHTAFLDAAEVGNVELVKILQEHGADINQVTGKRKWSAVHICADRGHSKCLKTLLTFPDVNIDMQNSEGRTPLHEATIKSNFTIVKLLCDKGAKVDVRDKKKRTAFLDAAKAGDLEIVRRLKKQGADINQVSGHHKWSALHEAASGDWAEMAKYLIDEKIKKDLKVKSGTKKDMTAKEIAEKCESEEFLKIL
ncbi:MAG: hypothetical protein Q9165_001346 [Trypethelium subeluteriae]